METRYNQNGPALFKKQNGEVELSHSHYKDINYQSFYGNRGSEYELQQILGEQKVAIKGCMKFFKTFSKEKNLDINLRAAAKAALAEDKERLKNIEKHMESSSSCVIL